MIWTELIRIWRERENRKGQVEWSGVSGLSASTRFLVSAQQPLGFCLALRPDHT
jgi:hypothetical protein